jgi:hypothetical protein
LQHDTLAFRAPLPSRSRSLPREFSASWFARQARFVPCDDRIGSDERNRAYNAICEFLVEKMRRRSCAQAMHAKTLSSEFVVIASYRVSIANDFVTEIVIAIRPRRRHVGSGAVDPVSCARDALDR